MTILEWMGAATRYTFDETIFQKIAVDREISVTQDATTLTFEQKELLTADLIFTAVVLSPSSTSSESMLHNNFQHSYGSESISNEKRNSDIKWMKYIYQKYNDPKFDYLNSISTNKIRIISIQDVI